MERKEIRESGVGTPGALENGHLVAVGRGGSDGVSLERPESGLGECPGRAAVRAAGRAGTEPGRPHGPGGPARPAPAAKLKGGRSLSSLFPTAPPRAPGEAQAGLTSGPRVTKGGIIGYGTPPASRPVGFALEVPRLPSNYLH